MGFFSFYCGFLYNDFLSLNPNIFGTCYIDRGEEYEVKRKHNCVYAVGVDPVWTIARNELAFYNSLKMKFSVIIGVIQMIFGFHFFYYLYLFFLFYIDKLINKIIGILLKGLNAIYFSSKLDFFFEFIP